MERMLYQGPEDADTRIHIDIERKGDSILVETWDGGKSMASGTYTPREFLTHMKPKGMYPHGAKVTALLFDKGAFLYRPLTGEMIEWPSNIKARILGLSSHRLARLGQDSPVPILVGKGADGTSTATAPPPMLFAHKGSMNGTVCGSVIDFT